MTRYEYKYNYDLIIDYVLPSNSEEWLDCPECGLKPKVWLFNNGRSTGCGCHNSTYDHRSIHAESIMSHHKRNNGSTLTYDVDALQKNWNHWCKTGEELFLHAGQRTDDKW